MERLKVDRVDDEDDDDDHDEDDERRGLEFRVVLLVAPDCAWTEECTTVFAKLRVNPCIVYVCTVWLYSFEDTGRCRFFSFLEARWAAIVGGASLRDRGSRYSCVVPVVRYRRAC